MANDDEDKTLTDIDIQILKCNCKPLKVDYNIGKYSSIINCRNHSRSNNHVCQLNIVNDSNIDIFILASNFHYYYNAPNYTCKSDHNQMYNLLIHNTSFKLENGDHIITTPEIFQLAANLPIFITEDIIYRLSTIICDIANNVTTIRNNTIANHKTELIRILKTKCSVLNIDRAIDKIMPSLYLLKKMDNNIFINHMLKLFQKIQRFVYKKPFQKIAIDYTFRMAKNIYDWHNLSHQYNINLNDIFDVGDNNNNYDTDDNKNSNNSNDNDSTFSGNNDQLIEMNNNANANKLLQSDDDNYYQMLQHWSKLSIDVDNINNINNNNELDEFALYLHDNHYNIKHKYNVIIASACNEYGFVVDMGMSTNNESHFDLVRRFANIFGKHALTVLNNNNSNNKTKIHSTFLCCTDGYTNYTIGPKIKEYCQKHYELDSDTLHNYQFEVCITLRLHYFFVFFLLGISLVALQSANLNDVKCNVHYQSVITFCRCHLTEVVMANLKNFFSCVCLILVTSND